MPHPDKSRKPSLGSLSPAPTLATPPPHPVPSASGRPPSSAALRSAPLPIRAAFCVAPARFWGGEVADLRGGGGGG